MTIYELIGRIKDGTQPKYIEVFDETFKYDEENKNYYDTEDYSLFDDYTWLDDLNTKIDNWYDWKGTINNNKDGIEKIIVKDMKIQAESTGNYCYSISQPMKIMINKINELIDEVNKSNEGKNN